MKTLNIVRHLLVTAAFALTLASLAGCAVESGGDQTGNEPGTDDLVNGSSDDPTAVHTGGGTGNVAEFTKGVALPGELPLAQSAGGQGPQPEPWAPSLAIRSAGESGDNHK